MQQTGMMSCCHRRCQEPLESNKNRGKEKREWNLSYTAVITDCYCVIPENIHTSPTEGIFSNTFPPLWKFWSSIIHFLFFDLPEPLISQEIPIPSVGGEWLFSGTAQYYSCSCGAQGFYWLIVDKDASPESTTSIKPDQIARLPNSRPLGCASIN